MPGFGVADFVAERHAIENGRFRQFFVHTVEMDAAKSGEGAADIEVDANCISLEPEIWPSCCASPMSSDTTKKVYLRFNSKDAPWIPFSLVAAGGHKQVANGTIYRVWIKIPAASVVPGGRLYFLLTLSFGLSSGTGGVSASGYVAPTGSVAGTGSSGSSGSGGSTDSGSSGGDYSDPFNPLAGRGRGYNML